MFEKSDDITWSGGIGILLVLLLIGAAINFGAMSLELKYNLKKSECMAAYWKARAQGQPSNYCPAGCECDVRLFR